MQGVKVKESKIAGLGLFTDQEFNEGDLIGIAHINGQPSPMIGKYHNHSDNPNAHSILLGNKRYIAALRPLKKGEEITVDYRKQPELEQPEEFAKGGLVSMPKGSKKGLASKRYTKDLTGTNRLFTKNALLKKPKSKKNRVYNPNAKYYAEGGESETEVVPEMPTPDPGNAISSAPTFNAAFKIARSTYGPNHIFEYQGRKYGTNLIGEDFKPSEDVLAQAGLNTPSVKENLNKQNSDLNDPYASKSTVKLEPDSYKSWDEIKQKNLELNTSANADKIINYKNNIGGDKNYIIVDKKKGLMHVYEPGNSKPLFTSPVDLGATESDAQTVTKIKDTNGDGKIDSKEAQVGAADFDKGNKSTGAGKYYISNIDPEGYGGLPLFNMMNESQYENFLKTGKVDNVATSIHKGFIPDDNSRVSNGCIRCNKTTLSNLTKYLENSSEVYILPEDPNNEFIIENDKLNFKVKNKSPYYTYKNNGKVYKKENGAWYIAPKMGEQFVKITQIDRIKELNKNATNARYNFYEDAKGNVQKGQGVNLGSTLNYVPIKAKLDKEKFVNDKFTYFDFSDDKELEVVNKFVSSLEQNKQKAMKVAKINGDVYNDIAQIAFGIFGTESNFADTHSAVGNLARAAQKYFDPKGSSSPDYQSKYSTYGAKEDSRSVGLTQIRWNYLSADEKKALKSVGINSNADFMEPSKAALGTTVVLGIRYNQQLTDKQKKDIWTTLPKTWNTRDNYASRVLDNSKYLSLEQKVTNKNSATKKDKWGRPSTSKWYGFNPKTKKYEYLNGGTVDQNEYEMGGVIELDIPESEIAFYVNGGYIVEDISVPSLNRMDNGGTIYAYSGNPNASYKKIGDQWYISNKGTGNNFVPIKDPDGKRTAELNKNAVVLPGQPAVEQPRGVQGNVGPAKLPGQAKMELSSATRTAPTVQNQEKIKTLKAEVKKESDQAAEIARKKQIEKEKEAAALLAQSNPSDNPNGINQNVVLPQPSKLGYEFNQDKERHLRNLEINQALNSGNAALVLGDAYRNQNDLSLRDMVAQGFAIDPSKFEKATEDSDKFRNALNDAGYNNFLKKEQEAYNKLGLLDKGLNEAANFLADPVYTGSQWLGGNRTLVGQGTGVRDGNKSEYQYYNRATGLHDNWLNNIFNFVNPGSTGASARVHWDNRDVAGFGGDMLSLALKAKVGSQGLKATSAEISDVLKKNILGTGLTGNQLLKGYSAYEGATKYAPRATTDLLNYAQSRKSEDLLDALYSTGKVAAAYLPFTKFNDANAYPIINEVKSTFGGLDSSVKGLGDETATDYHYKTVEKANKLAKQLGKAKDAAIDKANKLKNPMELAKFLRFAKPQKTGGSVETELTEQEIQDLIAQGYVIEQV